jgi:uncharacterized membrane protein YdjX (TVP38/TMEM64 family)
MADDAPPSQAPSSGDRTLPIALSLIPLVLLVLAAAGLVLFSEGFRGELVVAWDLMRAGDPEGVRDWLLGFGGWAPLMSALLQVATSVFPPGPSFLLGIANAMVFGMVLGGLLTFVTQLGAAAVCFGIARVVGRPGVERLVSTESLARVDGFMRRRGVVAVFLGRLIPFINPDLVSYAAGVTGIRWAPFMLAVGAGAVPSTLFYSVIGATALEATGWVVGAVTVSTVLPLFLLLLFRRRISRWYAERRDSDQK